MQEATLVLLAVLFGSLSGVLLTGRLRVLLGNRGPHTEEHRDATKPALSLNSAKAM